MKILVKINDVIYITLCSTSAIIVYRHLVLNVYTMLSQILNAHIHVQDTECE